jgi:hypothetical protein
MTFSTSLRFGICHRKLLSRFLATLLTKTELCIGLHDDCMLDALSSTNEEGHGDYKRCVGKCMKGSVRSIHQGNV